MKQFRLICEAVILGVVTIVAGLVLILLIRVSPFWSQEAAGWAQAIGTVAAIFVTIILFVRQSEAIALHAYRERQHDLLQRRETVYAVCVRAIEMIDEMLVVYFCQPANLSRIEEYFEESFSARAFSHMSETLAAVPLHELGSYHLTTGVLDLRDAIEACETLGSEGEKYEACLPWFEENYAKFLRVQELRDSGLSSTQIGIDRAREQIKATLNKPLIFEFSPTQSF